jgi:hypothetical protein
VLFVSTYPNEGVAKKKAEISPACLYSQMDLPIEAAVWTADGPAAPDKPSEPLPGNLCFLRMGDVAVGIQFMLALDTDGKPATAQVVNDGAALGARHLSVTHTAGPLESGRGVVAVRVRAAEGLDDAGFAAFRQSFSQAKSSARMDGSVVHLKADGLSGPLALDADLSAGKILNATGADPAMLAAPMSVNGKEFCKSILQTSGPAGF